LLCILQKTNGEIELGFNGDLYPTAGATSVMTTKGDMVDYNTARQRLGIGSANQILQVKSNLPSWETVDLADTVLTTAGDVLYENATPELARLAKGTQYNNLQMGASLPAWASSSTSILSASGDILYASGANTLAKLAKASDGDTLQLASGVPAWVTVAGGGGNMVLIESFTASASDVLTCTLSTPIALADFVELIFIFNGEWQSTTGAGQLEMQIATDNYLIDDGRYHSQETVLTTSAGFTQTTGVDSWQVGTCSSASGSKGSIWMSITVPDVTGGGGGGTYIPSDIYIKWWQVSRSQYQVRGSGFTYDNVGAIDTIVGAVFTNTAGDNFHTSSTVDVYKVTR